MKIPLKLETVGDDKNVEASVSFWYYDEGESVSEGTDIVEVVTDKATFNVQAPKAGVITKINAKEGDAVKAGDILGEIETKE